MSAEPEQLEHGLADEVVLAVHPTLLGTGKRFFAEGTPARSFMTPSASEMLTRSRPIWGSCRASTRPIGFELSPDEAPYARGLAEEIEAAFPGHLAMLPEVGKVIFPDIDALHELGKVTLFDCLFTERW